MWNPDSKSVLSDSEICVNNDAILPLFMECLENKKCKMYNKYDVNT